jgi:hypothetical protein
MSDSLAIPRHRARVVADAVVSAYINEIAAPARPRPTHAQSAGGMARRPATHGARRRAHPPRRAGALELRLSR